MPWAEFKQQHFRTDHPGCPIPVVADLAAAEATHLRARLAVRLGLSPDETGLKVLKALANASANYSATNAEAPEFDLLTDLREQGVSPLGSVYVNWNRFDDITRVRVDDLARYFADFWYPGPDDIEVFDETCDWVLSVSHDGVLSCALLPQPSG